MNTDQKIQSSTMYEQPEFIIPYKENFDLKDDVKATKTIGIKAIQEKGICVVILAGGQGTRLGISDPKGCYILPEIKKSIFELHCKSIKMAQESFNTQIKLLVMTSSHTHEMTLEFFKKNKYFGLDENDLVYFKQEDIACLDNSEKYIPFGDGYATAPNGNGAIFKTMADSGIYKHLEKVKYCNVISVDNVLARVVDPVIIGYMEENDLDVCSKSVTKRDEESVGVFLKKDGCIVVREYNELQNLKEYSHLIGPGRKIQGNICNHTFKIDFMKRVAEENLPTHRAYKKIPFSDENGKIIRPRENNGYKREKFIFDSFEFTKKSGLVSVPRELEFSPVKNGIEVGVDTPKTAVEDIYQMGKILLKTPCRETAEEYLSYFKDTSKMD